MGEIKKGRYYQDKRVYEKLKNPEKYVGKVKQVTTRSRWEKIYILNFLDKDPRVIEYSSEDIIIPYVYDVDGRYHRYFPDFWMKIHTKNGIKEVIVEIKPFKECFKPKKPQRQSKNYLKRLNNYNNALLTYVKNQNKWDATIKFCEKIKQKKGTDISFMVITEKDLFV